MSRLYDRTGGRFTWWGVGQDGDTVGRGERGGVGAGGGEGVWAELLRTHCNGIGHMGVQCPILQCNGPVHMTSSLAYAGEIHRHLATPLKY